MGPIPMVISGVVSLVMYSLVILGIYKVFQIGTDVNEIRDLLRDIKRNTQDLSPTASHLPSAVPLAQALKAYEDDPAHEPEPADLDR